MHYGAKTENAFSVAANTDITENFINEHNLSRLPIFAAPLAALFESNSGSPANGKLKSYLCFYP